jgi:hypothetical protein
VAVGCGIHIYECECKCECEYVSEYVSMCFFVGGMSMRQVECVRCKCVRVCDLGL